MDVFPANAIEDPFLGAGEHDPATQGHRGSSPQRAMDVLDLRLPDFAGIRSRDSPGSSGAGEGGDDHLTPLPPPPHPSPIDEFAASSFGESLAADTLVSLGTSWPSSSPTGPTSQFTHFNQLQTTICPEAVRPRTNQPFRFSLTDQAIGIDLDSPLMYALINDVSPGPSTVTPLHAHSDVPAHPDVYEPDTAYDLVRHPGYTSSSYSSYSETPMALEPEYTTLRYATWPIDPLLNFPRHRRVLSRCSSATSETWSVAPMPLELSPSALPRTHATLDLPCTPATPDLAYSPAVSMVEPELDTTRLDLEGTAPPEEDEEVVMGMDSPTQVYQQLTDPIDGTEVTEIGSDDEDYVDKVDMEDEDWARVPTRQAQNHRRTFKMALWE